MERKEEFLSLFFVTLKCNMILHVCDELHTFLCSTIVQIVSVFKCVTIVKVYELHYLC